MGTWGTGTFENDDALDWVAELEEHGLSAVQTVLDDAAGSEEFMQGDVAARMLAGAEVLAALLGKPATDLPEEVSGWVASNKKPPSLQLLSAMRKSLDWISEESELSVLWQESGELEEWRQKVSDLRARLG